MKKQLALMMCVLLICVLLGGCTEAKSETDGTEYAQAFLFRNGVTWNSTPKEVIAAENAEYRISGGEGDYWLGYQASVSKYSEQWLCYIFLQDQLMCAVYSIGDTSQKDMTYLTKALSLKYGAPAGTNAEEEWKRMEPYSDMLSLHLDEEYFGGDWECRTLADGTYLSIFRYCYDSYDQEEGILILYLNEPALLEKIGLPDLTGL